MKTSNPLAKIFDEIFDRNLKKQIPHEKAYEESENEFQGKFNHRKYSSFDSFRISRINIIKKKK